jgi:hypothetical protein
VPTYYVICTYISPPTSAQVLEAVYPPQAGEVTPSSVEEGLEKSGAVVREGETIKDKDIV